MVAANVDTVEIATQAIEAVGSIAAGIENLRIVEISQDYYDLYKDQREFYYSTFQQGAEAPLINEVFSIPFYIKNYVGRANPMYNGSYGALGGASTDTQGWWSRHSAMYGDVIDPRITSLPTDRIKIEVEWVNHMFRLEDKWADHLNDFRWEKRIAIHNIANKQAYDASSALDAGLGSYTNNIQDFSNMLSTYANGASAFLGYRRGMADTYDDFNSGTMYARGSVSYETKSHLDNTSLPTSAGISYGSRDLNGFGAERRYRSPMVREYGQ